MTLSHALAFPTLRPAYDIAMGKMRRQFTLNPGRAADRARQPRMAQCRDAQDMPRARLLLTRLGDLSSYVLWGLLYADIFSRRPVVCFLRRLCSGGDPGLDHAGHAEGGYSADSTFPVVGGLSVRVSAEKSYRLCARICPGNPPVLWLV
jgi:hypothetical protein